MKNFYPVTPELAETLRQGKLTAAEWRIWSYLISVDPWGNQYKDVDTLTVMSICEVSKATYYRAIAKFDELELFDFQDKGFSIKNRYGATNLRNETPESLDIESQSQICKTSLKNETSFSKKRKTSQICENQSPEPLSSLGSTTPKINKIIKTNKKRERGEILKFLESNQGFREFCVRKAMELPDRPVLVESWISSNIQELESLYKSKSSPVDKSSAAGCENFPEVEILFPKVSAAIALEELKQDPVFPDGVFDLEGNWYKKADWEAMQNDHNN